MSRARLPSLLTPAELMALVVEPSWADEDPGERRMLVVDLDAQSGLTATDLDTLRAWLGRQPVPVIGVQTARANELDDVADLVVSSEAELERALANVRRNPLAAAVLVQVLRSTCAMSAQEALTFESLAYATLQSGREFRNWLAAFRAWHSGRAGPAPENVVLLNRDGDRLEIVLNDPESRNALSVAMRDALTEAFKLVALDTSIAQVTVSANGPCFSSGGELGEFGTLTDPAQAHMIRMLRMPARYLIDHADRYTFHVHRACIGAGIELPAFAHRLTATANTFFQLPELGMGLIPGAGGCVSIPRRIGRQRTAYMALLGKKIPAQRALDWGLIDAIVD